MIDAHRERIADMLKSNKATTVHQRLLYEHGFDVGYELVTERTGKSLIITANRSASDWYLLFPNPVVAEFI